MILRILFTGLICTIVLLPLQVKAQGKSNISRYAQRIGAKLNSEKSFPKNTSIVKEVMSLHSNLKELDLMRVLGKPYLSLVTDMVLPRRYRYNSISRLFRLKTLADSGFFDKNRPLSINEIANKQPWYTGFKPNINSLYRERTFMNGKTMPDEKKRLFEGYQHDEFIRKEMSFMLTNENLKLFFESDIKPQPKSSGGLFTPKLERQTPNWGGDEDPMIVKSAYQKFLSSGILDTLATVLRDIDLPNEGVSFIYAYIAPDNTASEAFNLKFFLDGFDIPQVESELRGFSYQLKVSEEKANELKSRPYRTVRGIVNLNISNYSIVNLQEAYLKGENFQSTYSMELMNTMIDFYAMDDFMFEKPLFSVDLKNCKPEKY